MRHRPPDPCATGYGLRLQSDGNTIAGNFIGLTADGVIPASNEAGGILVAGNGNTIGGTTSAERNVIGGNAVPSSVRSQILVTGNTNTIKGNYVGVAANGTTQQNAVTGITVQSSAHDNVIGGDKTVGNVILGAQGIEVSSNAGTGNIIAGNNIGLDAAGAVHTSALPGIHVGGTGTVIGDNISPPANANPDKGNVIVGSSDAGIFLQGETARRSPGTSSGRTVPGLPAWEMATVSASARAATTRRAGQYLRVQYRVRSQHGQRHEPSRGELDPRQRTRRYPQRPLRHDRASDIDERSKVGHEYHRQRHLLGHSEPPVLHRVLQEHGLRRHGCRRR